MHTTSVSLIERLRQPGDKEAWGRLVELYTPLLFFWAKKLGLQEQDAADLVQDVFAILVRKMPEFMYNPDKSFRGWLRTILMNKWRDGERRRGIAPAHESPENLARFARAEDAEPFGDEEYRQHLVGRALDLMRAEFQPTTWKACWETVAADRPPAEVAKELGISVDSVYAAKSRVLRRLRQELEGLLE
jgi:RNA polymerase sigma-70 factor (ECF subfamily)